MKAISASLVLLPDQSLFHPSGNESELEGKPFNMVVREALETCGSYEEVFEFMQNNKRTLDAFVGVADTKKEEDQAFKTLIYRFYQIQIGLINFLIKAMRF